MESKGYPEFMLAWALVNPVYITAITTLYTLTNKISYEYAIQQSYYV